MAEAGTQNEEAVICVRVSEIRGSELGPWAPLRGARTSLPKGRWHWATTYLSGYRPGTRPEEALSAKGPKHPVVT